MVYFTRPQSGPFLFFSISSCRMPLLSNAVTGRTNRCGSEEELIRQWWQCILWLGYHGVPGFVHVAVSTQPSHVQMCMFWLATSAWNSRSPGFTGGKTVGCFAVTAQGGDGHWHIFWTLTTTVAGLHQPCKVGPPFTIAKLKLVEKSPITIWYL